MLMSAKPDGYTLLLGTVGTQVVNKMLYTKLNYDPAAMTPVSLVSNAPYVLAVNGIDGDERPCGPGQLCQGAPWPAEFRFQREAAALPPRHRAVQAGHADEYRAYPVQERGGSGQRRDRRAGQHRYRRHPGHPAAGQGQSPKKILAIAAAKHNPALPDMPTSVEQGIPDFQIGSWNALVAPPGTPADRVDMLNHALAKALQRPEVVSRLAEMGIETLPTGLDAYRKHVASETDKWTKVIQAAGTRLD